MLLFELHWTPSSVDVPVSDRAAPVSESLAESDVEFEDRCEAWNRFIYAAVRDRDDATATRSCDTSESRTRIPISRKR